MTMTKTYYKVVSSEESVMAGAGLGYEEIYGNRPRYYWSREQAKQRAALLNSPEYGDAGSGTYSVEERQFYHDGSFDDDADTYAREQLQDELE